MKRQLQSICRAFGYELRRYKRPGGGYGPIQPYATYTPWDTDAAFLEAYRRIESHTLVDKYRCFELWNLVKQSKRCEGALVEVGVWRGGTGALIAQRARLSNIGDPVYLCDTFSGVVKATSMDSHYAGGEHSDTNIHVVEQLLDDLKLSNVLCLTGIFPEQTAPKIKESSLRFCHVDVDVYEAAKDITEWVWPKLCVGGVIVYDDYGFESCDGVTKYVDEELLCRGGRAIIYNLNGHAVMVKTAPS